MNIVIGYAGYNANEHFQRLNRVVESHFNKHVPLSTEKSADGLAIFSLIQPGGYYPLEQPVYSTIEKKLIMLHGYLWYRDHFPLTKDAAIRQILNASRDLVKENKLTLSKDDGGIFNLFTYNQINRVLHIASDPAGIIPLYYAVSKTGIFFSNHLKILANLLGKPIDEIGITEQAIFHYTIGKRTLYKEIYRLNPGETFTFNLLDQKVNIKQAEKIFSHIDKYRNDKEAVDAMYFDFISGLKEMSRKNLKYGLLLSGGLDSRLVGYGFKVQEKAIASLTFGDDDNYEVVQAKKVANLLNSDHLVHSPVDDYHLDADKLDRFIKIIGTINYPFLISSPKLLKELGADTISTGYACEAFLGGQGYFLLGDKWSQKGRFRNAIFRSLGIPINFTIPSSKESINAFIADITSYHNNLVMKRKSYFSDEWQESYFKDVEEKIADEIFSEINRYLINDPGSIQQIAERFVFDTHGTKDINNINLFLMQYFPLVLPTLHHSFIVRGSNLPPNRKSDHGLYFKFVKKYFGDLAKIPTANIPISLKYPITLLWISRALKVGSDKRSIKNQMNSSGATKSARLGWTNFETWFRHGDFLSEASAFIDNRLFSRSYFEQKLERTIRWEERVFMGLDFLEIISISQLIK